MLWPRNSYSKCCIVYLNSLLHRLCSLPFPLCVTLPATVVLRIICQSRVTGVSDVSKYGPCHASPSMTDERSSMWHTSKLGNFARIFDFSTLVLLIFILWHSPFSNPPKIHSRSAENMIALDEIGGLSHAFRQGDEMKHSSGVSQSRRGDEQFVILQYQWPTLSANTLLRFNY